MFNNLNFSHLKNDNVPNTVFTVNQNNGNELNSKTRTLLCFTSFDFFHWVNLVSLILFDMLFCLPSFGTKLAFWNCLECLFDLMIHHFSSQDTEVYKTTVKDDITKWQNVLKAHSSMDWLIVVVESDAKKKNKTNILSRTSIVDKIRNDFCNKQSDRWAFLGLQTFLSFDQCADL